MLLDNDKGVHTELVESPTVSSLCRQNCMYDMNLFRLVQKASCDGIGITRKQLAHTCPLVVELRKPPTAVRTMASGVPHALSATHAHGWALDTRA